MLWNFNPHTCAIFSIIPLLSVLFQWDMICTSWKIKVALNLLKKLCKTLYPIMLITIWEFKKSNHQGHDFDLLALKFKLRCVSTGCNVTMVTYYVPKTAISMNALSFMSDCCLFYERHY